MRIRTRAFWYPVGTPRALAAVVCAHMRELLQLAREPVDAKHTRQTLSLLMLDVDHFKTFNDTHGHALGDQVLRLIATTLTQNVRGQDVVARFGGEEFAVILPKTDLSHAVSVAENIRRAVAANDVVKRQTGEKLGRMTVSIGEGAQSRR